MVEASKDQQFMDALMVNKEFQQLSWTRAVVIVAPDYKKEEECKLCGPLTYRAKSEEEWKWFSKSPRIQKDPPKDGATMMIDNPFYSLKMLQPVTEATYTKISNNMKDIIESEYMAGKFILPISFMIVSENLKPLATAYFGDKYLALGYDSMTTFIETELKSKLSLELQTHGFNISSWKRCTNKLKKTKETCSLCQAIQFDTIDFTVTSLL